MKIQSIFQKIKHKKINYFIPNIGGTALIGIRINEGEKYRIQYFQGIVISKHQSFNSVTIIVRKIFQNIGIERLFPLDSPQIDSVSIIKPSKAKRAKLFYLRKKIGKAATRV